MHCLILIYHTLLHYTSNMIKISLIILFEMFFLSSILLQKHNIVFFLNKPKDIVLKALNLYDFALAM